MPHPMGTIRKEHQLLAILCVLDGDFGPSSNDEVLGTYLSAIGLGCSHKELQERLAELAEGGLVRVEHRERLRVVELTRDGSEVASGVVTRAGIARSSPDCPYR